MRTKFVCYILIILLLIPRTVSAADYARLKEGGAAKVVEVIGGEAIRVQMTATGENALVHIAGIESLGSEAAFHYLNRTLVGKTVDLSFYNSTPSFVNNKWNYMTVMRGNENIGLKLVSLGYAAVVQDEAADINSLLNAANAANAAGRGIWDKRFKYNNAYPQTDLIYGEPETGYTGSGININTATRAMFIKCMPDVPPSVVDSIINYRAVNPFRKVTDICYVPGFSLELFYKYMTVMTPVTNINRATLPELSTLGGITDEEAAAVLSFREKTKLTDTAQLVTNRLIPQGLYNTLKDFLSVTDVSALTLTPPNRANINTSSHDELTAAGLKAAAADAIISARRETNYTFKTLGELAYLPGCYLNAFEIYALADNLLIDREDYIININLASINEMLNIGMTGDEANMIYERRRWHAMTNVYDIPAGIEELDELITLYTNVNTAGLNELLSLGIGAEAAQAIIRYRAGAPFGNLDTLRMVMGSVAPSAEVNDFDYIKDFVTIR